MPWDSVSQTPDAAPAEPEPERGIGSIYTTDPALTEEPGVLQSMPKGRGSNDAEKVTGGAIVEPTAPDVGVPAKQAQHITRSWNPIPAICQSKLGAAVLVRAFEDARTDSRARQWFE